MVLFEKIPWGNLLVLSYVFASAIFAALRGHFSFTLLSVAQAFVLCAPQYIIYQIIRRTEFPNICIKRVFFAFSFLIPLFAIIFMVVPAFAKELGLGFGLIGKVKALSYFFYPIASAFYIFIFCSFSFVSRKQYHCAAGFLIASLAWVASLHNFFATDFFSLDKIARNMMFFSVCGVFYIKQKGLKTLILLPIVASIVSINFFLGFDTLEVAYENLLGSLAALLFLLFDVQKLFSRFKYFKVLQSLYFFVFFVTVCYFHLAAWFSL